MFVFVLNYSAKVKQILGFIKQNVTNFKRFAIILIYVNKY